MCQSFQRQMQSVPIIKIVTVRYFMTHYDQREENDSSRLFKYADENMWTDPPGFYEISIQIRLR